MEGVTFYEKDDNIYMKPGKRLITNDMFDQLFDEKGRRKEGLEFEKVVRSFYQKGIEHKIKKNDPRRRAKSLLNLIKDVLEELKDPDNETFKDLVLYGKPSTQKKVANILEDAKEFKLGDVKETDNTADYLKNIYNMLKELQDTFPQAIDEIRESENIRGNLGELAKVLVGKLDLIDTKLKERDEAEEYLKKEQDKYEYEKEAFDSLEDNLNSSRSNARDEILKAVDNLKGKELNERESKLVKDNLDKLLKKEEITRELYDNLIGKLNLYIKSNNDYRTIIEDDIPNTKLFLIDPKKEIIWNDNYSKEIKTSKNKINEDQFKALVKIAKNNKITPDFHWLEANVKQLFKMKANKHVYDSFMAQIIEKFGNQSKGLSKSKSSAGFVPTPWYMKGKGIKKNF